MIEKNQHIQLSKQSVGDDRIDRFLAQVLGVSRATIKKEILDGHVFVDDQVVEKTSYLISYQSVCRIVFTLLGSKRPLINDCSYIPHESISCSEFSVPIVYEDDDLLVLNKPYGVIVHPAPSVSSITLVDLMLQAGVSLHDLGNNRSGIVHRLDQYTEGLIIVAKTDIAMSSLQSQFKDRAVVKKYYAVLSGCLVDDEGEINRPIGRDQSLRVRQSCHHYLPGTEKNAVTRYQVIQRLSNLTVVDVDLITGRMHQIRVHFSTISVPVLGDSLYSRQNQKPEGYYLQSYFIRITHPITQENVEWRLPMSDRLKKYAK